VASETDAARDRVVAARAAFGDELETLQASVRTAVDVPAKIRRNPVRTAAIAGGTGFVLLKGPQRLFRAGKRAVFGAPEPLPASLLPEQVEKAIRAMGSDGAKVRGALERDFAAYAKQAQRERTRLRTVLLLAVVRPLLTGAARAGVKRLFSTDDAAFQARLAQIRERSGRLAGSATSVDAARAEVDAAAADLDKAVDDLEDAAKSLG
jgi:hypothetical protein